jgi:hypothetical protein
VIEAPRRPWWSVRWRQFRNAPRPVVRAVVTNLVAAGILGVLYLAYDVALSRGARLPGGDLRPAFGALDVLLVLAVGTIVTYFIVPLPRGTDARPRRTVWSAALGFFAAVPIAYMVLVVVIQVIRPLLT